jgi:hypothetical protein
MMPTHTDFLMPVVLRHQRAPIDSRNATQGIAANEKCFAALLDLDFRLCRFAHCRARAKAFFA